MLTPGRAEAWTGRRGLGLRWAWRRPRASLAWAPAEACAEPTRFHSARPGAQLCSLHSHPPTLPAAPEPEKTTARQQLILRA